jgi:preprotein translocase subunit SecF
MFGRLYTRLVGKTNYKVMAALTPAIAVLMIPLILFNGLQYSIDFRGGMWIEAYTDNQITPQQLADLRQDLESIGLEEVKADIGYDINTGQNKLIIQTITVFDRDPRVEAAIEKYAGELVEFDTAKASISSSLPAGFKETLENRLRFSVDVESSDTQIILRAMNLEVDELESALSYYLGQDISVELQKKNYNIRSVGPTLGKTFRDQGFKAVIASFILMSVVVFIAFREFIPCIAVIQAALCDILIALGGMSLLGIPLEPASIGALLMLIGYSVDSDIMLTTKTMKDKSRDFDSLVDDALKTGFTMTGTTLAALAVIFIISTTLTQVSTWANISAVLIIGLIGDLPITWLTNTGIIKWYIESGRSIRKRGGRR